MKVGMLCHASYGGSGVVAAELGKCLAKRGHEVHFITVGRPFRLENYQKNIFIHEVGAFHHPLFEVPPYFITQVNKTLEVLRNYDLDLLHAHYAVPHSLSALLARQIFGKYIPVITTLHGTDTSLVGAHQEFYQTTRYSLEKSDLVTVVSSFLAEQTRQTFHFTGELPVLYNFVNTEVFKPEVRIERKSVARIDEAILIHISNFRPLKRVLDVIHIFKGVRQKRRARLILIGDGPDMPAVQKLAKRLGLTQDINFLGQIDNVAPILAAADVLLYPSSCESFGLVALESLSCGVPVVAAHACGIPEVVIHGQVGFLAEVGDVKEMARYTLMLLEDNDLKQKISNNARNYAISQFNAEQWVVKYESIYKELLNHKQDTQEG
ncbi:glycosyl transferase, group 1 [Desulforamulus reducens MI-1]|uniref:Glycosyl transferase, group 1 n=1 Tax=Desulforamulus reducens (strain ATCC BAA-1160 / DSM 100696 / MI-1) TaxID=349161 RepID=A4J6Y0_DESRM|nr:N-acetyl-alpha-D-glucosaminyl L-malate synthase BshA [Desulforamulus reducens]ABO50833.1 glycosyl transferase, group 1 [Desulforamulus reducens MI-1]